jgi:hypothetical protein
MPSRMSPAILVRLMLTLLKYATYPRPSFLLEFYKTLIVIVPKRVATRKAIVRTDDRGPKTGSTRQRSSEIRPPAPIIHAAER